MVIPHSYFWTMVGISPWAVAPNILWKGVHPGIFKRRGLLLSNIQLGLPGQEFYINKMLVNIGGGGA